MNARGVALVAAAMLGWGSRAWLLLRDQTASGYDAWYYVLQTRSVMAGEPLFADRSVWFTVLAFVARLTGDVVAAQEWMAALGAGAAVGLGAWLGARLGGWPGGLWVAALWVGSTGHLALSAEFLKNGAGLVPLVGVLACLVGPMSAARWAGAVGLALLAMAVHKLCGALALLALVGAAMASGAGAKVWWGLGAGALGAAGLGVLRAVDVLRIGGETGVGRWERLASSSLRPSELVEVALVHVTPLLVPLAWGRSGPEVRPLIGGLALISLACLAPGLPFDFESTAWRLVVMGFVPLGLLAACCRPSPVVAAGLATLAVLALPVHLDAHARRSPDYAAWEAYLPQIRAEVPEGARLVAHRGLCGFLWAEGGIPCENFAPTGDPAGWMRVVYGVEREALARHGDVVALRPGYSLVAEPTWRAFAEAEPERRMLHDPRNPYEPRPDYVYGPGAPP